MHVHKHTPRLTYQQSVDCESLAPTQGATQQSVDCESLTPTQGATQQSVDCESLAPTQGATQQSVDCESLTPTQGATQQSVDCESLTPSQGATHQTKGDSRCRDRINLGLWRSLYRGGRMSANTQNPSFGPFPQVCCSITRFSTLLVHLGCAIFYLSPPRRQG